MDKICVFAGTTEGRRIVEFLSGQPVLVTAWVATEYGETLLTPAPNVTVSAGRLTEEQMVTLFTAEKFDLVVDATHPYARVVTENIAAACGRTCTKYLRLLRFGSSVPDDAVFVPDISEAVSYLNTTDGRILLTTGSKELGRYTAIQDFEERVYVRVLPMEDSLRLCRENGVKYSHILAMQGPFSVEMNVAMLKSMDAKYLVTKDSGSAGGFDEKIAAAHLTGVKMVVIGRPPQGDGLNLADTIHHLCQQFRLHRKPQVRIVGIGPGSRASMTEEVRKSIAQADCLIGAKRVVEAAASEGQSVECLISPEQISCFIHTHPEYCCFTVAMSGDVGFYSGAKKLLPLLEDCDVSIFPGLSSLVYLCARLGTSYEDVVPISLHGREHNIVPDIRRNHRVFVLVGRDNGVGKLCRALTDAGLGQVKVSVGQRLSYPDERITLGTAALLAEQTFADLSAALIENPYAAPIVTPGLPDAAFLREEDVPMTKSEVRSVCLSKLCLTEGSIAWDVGAGSGSVAIEMALLVRKGHVYAIERKPSAVALLGKNRSHFDAENLTVVPGCAPDVCKDLPTPSHVFIGGSSGNLRDIISLLLERNPHVRIVATAITLESVAELTASMKRFAFSETEVVCINVAKNKKAGSCNLMLGQNPIYIFTMQGGKT